MLKVVCLNAGNYCGLGKQYVEILYDMVRRNLSEKVEGEFICFTDDVEPYAEGIIKRPLRGGLSGWWNKLYLFKKDLFNTGDRIVYFDLDTAIVGGLDNLIKYEGDFAILRDVYRPQGLQSSVMAWAANNPPFWDEWNKAGCPMPKGGDQAYIEGFFYESAPDILQELYPGQLRSYKQECQFEIPVGTRIVFFHGHPRPHECQGNWVEQIWKVGGGTTMELEMIGNVSDQVITDNIRHALGLDVELLAQQYMTPNDKTLLIVGGGPSLTDDLDAIRQQQEGGAVIWALNNAFGYLLENGIYPDAQIMLDGRLDNLKFVPEKTKATLIYAVQCHPEVIKRALTASERVLLWCPALAGIGDVLDEFNRKCAVIGVGSSVGMKAIGLAYLFGFKKVELYGYDSSYRDNDNHAYSQPLNNGERIIEVLLNGQKFRCAPWMASQATEFRDNMGDFVSKGMEFKVHGSGLLPAMAALMQTNDLEKIVLKDGLWWPATDVECKKAMDGEASGIPAIMKHVHNRRTAIQAGGNVGVWPINLSHLFGAVITFEPDPVNYQCLELNTKAFPNILTFNHGLSFREEQIDLHREFNNCGAHFVEGSGNIQLKTIDSLELKSCDLLCLDIEGYEYFAILGAWQTIIKHKPTIVCEQKGLGKKYGVNEENIEKLLLSMGYKVSDKINNDVIYSIK